MTQCLALLAGLSAITLFELGLGKQKRDALSLSVLAAGAMMQLIVRNPPF